MPIVKTEAKSKRRGSYLCLFVDRFYNNI